jgi:hypothetical protein
MQLRQGSLLSASGASSETGQASVDQACEKFDDITKSTEEQFHPQKKGER